MITDKVNNDATTQTRTREDTTQYTRKTINDNATTTQQQQQQQQQHNSNAPAMPTI